jgi:ribosomal protein L37E
MIFFGRRKMGFWRKFFAGGGQREEKRHDFDPELRYCPACATEYRPEISHCASCGLPLVTGKERIAAWQRQEKERAHRNREIAAGDLVVSLLTGKLPDMKASGLALAAAGIVHRIIAVSGCGGG